MDASRRPVSDAYVSAPQPSPMTDGVDVESPIVGQAAVADAPAHRGGMWQSLQHRDFRLIWFSNLAANFAMQMQMVARGWLVYAMTKSPMVLAGVTLSFMLPQAVFSLLGGVVADRARKKTVMVIAQALNAFATCYLATVIVQGHVTIWHFVVTGFFNGTVLSFSMPARSAVVPEIVGRNLLANAMALQSMVFNLSRVFGPVIAGVVIAILAEGNKSSAFGVGVIYYLISGLYLSAAICTGFMSYDGKPSARRDTSAWHDAKEGLAFIREDKLIQGLLVLGMFPMMFGFSASSLMPAFNEEAVHGGPDELGYLMMALGAGAICSSLLLAHLGDLSRKGHTMIAAGAAWALFLAAFAFCHHLPQAMVFCALIGFCSSMFGNLTATTVQLATEQSVRGRIMSVMMMTQGLMPIGVLLVSTLAEVIGINYALLIAAILLAISVWTIDRIYPTLRHIDKGHGDAVFTATIQRTAGAGQRENNGFAGNHRDPGAA